MSNLKWWFRKNLWPFHKTLTLTHIGHSYLCSILDWIIISSRLGMKTSSWFSDFGPELLLNVTSTCQLRLGIVSLSRPVILEQPQPTYQELDKWNITHTIPKIAFPKIIRWNPFWSSILIYVSNLCMHLYFHYFSILFAVWIWMFHKYLVKTQPRA